VKKIMFILGMAFAGYIGSALVEMTDRFLSLQTVLDAAIFIAVFICFAGLWRSRRWALWLSWGLAAAALALGGYLVHFSWTFWIFETPTLMERILSVLHPRVSVLVIFPVAWLIYFTRPKIRALFV
jgi:hypothetical protein